MSFRLVSLPSLPPRIAWSFLGLLGVTGWLTARLFGPLLTAPDTYLLGAHGDAIKNTYSFLWYVLHDRGLHFTGMNYPFGEHINFPDTQPALAWLVQGLIKAGVVAADPVAVMAALSWALALGVFATPLILYPLLRRAGLPGLWAALAALVITFQSPQFDRMNAHLALSYLAVLPGLWLLTVRLIERPGPARALALAAATAAASLLTGYYLMGALLLVGGYALMGVVLAAKSHRRAALRTGGWLLAAVLLPLAGTLLWLRLTDPAAAGRPADPYGFYVYITSWAGVFLPSMEPLATPWHDLFRHKRPDAEGFVYVGAVPAVALLLLAVRAGGYLLRRRARARLIVRPATPAFLRTGIWVAVLALLFAMAYPFRWGLLGLPDLLPPLKQLRALGRFAWLFYYIYGVFVAHYFWLLARYLRQRRAPAFAATLLVVVFGLWGVDAWFTAARFGRVARATPLTAEFLGEHDSYVHYLKQAGRYTDDFQAILPLPYFALGSEKWALGPVADFEYFRASWQTELPLAATMMSRTALPHARALLQQVASPLIARAGLPPLPSGKPYLVLVTPNQVLPPAQQRLLARARPLVANERVQLYELPLSALRTDDRAATLADAAPRVALPPATAAGYPTHLSGLTTHAILFRGYEDQPATEGFPEAKAEAEAAGRSGPGVARKPYTTAALDPDAAPTPGLTLYDGPLPGPTDTLRYEASIWIDLRTRLALPWLHAQQLDAAGRLLVDNDANGRAATDVQGHWVRLAAVFTRHPAAARLLIYADGADIRADDLLVRPLQTAVWGRTAAGVVTYNGYGLNGTPGGAPAGSLAPAAQR